MTKVTYTQGPVYKILQPLTKGKLVEIIEECQRLLGLEIIPEPIIEGGLLVVTKNGYKSMRFHTNSSEPWPRIRRNEMKLWKHCPEILYSGANQLRTFLKAFGGAECWTMEELRMFNKVFEDHGFQLENQKYLITQSQKKGLCKIWDD